MEHETAGTPMGGCKWSRKSTRKIAQQLKRLHIKVSPRTVAKLLKDMDYSLRVNLKTIESGSRKPRDPIQRDKQFCYIKQQCEAYAKRGLPIISIDAKSRELIGPFFQKGSRWANGPTEVFDHDFRSDAKGIGVLYGIYDFCHNKGFVCVGTSRDTSEFAVDAIRNWWLKMGRYDFPGKDELLMLADCGGSNSYRNRLWKYQLQVALCDKTGLKVRVCHYPAGASKWNPIEHRMFSFISINWAGQPLESYETMLNYIRTTKTDTGLRIRAQLNPKKYETKIKISDDKMASVKLKQYRVNPTWNYSITPHVTS
jgi:hypothetical protein